MVSRLVLRGVSAFLLAFACLFGAQYTALPEWFGWVGAGASVVLVQAFDRWWPRSGAVQ